MGKKLSSLRKQVRSIERQIDALKQDVAKLTKLAAPSGKSKSQKKTAKHAEPPKATKRGPAGKSAKPKEGRKVAKRKIAVAGSPGTSISTAPESAAMADEASRPTVG